MQTAFNVVQIVLSIALIMVILLQVRGGGLGGIFGQASTVFRTRRGVERTLFRLTVILVVLFIIASIVALRVSQ